MNTTKQVTRQIGKMVKVCALSVTLMSTFFIPTASAADGDFVESSPYKTSKINGHTYSFYSGILRGDASKLAIRAYSKVFADTTVPTGSMGQQAVLYDSTGRVVTASDMIYNDESLKGFYVYSPYLYDTTGKYFARSIAEFYNGNGYTSYTGNKSPIMTLKLNTMRLSEDKDIEEFMLKEEYDVNNNGETYGSLLSEYTIGEAPDLISAVGTNGEEGYVRAEDLTPEVSSIEEALEQEIENGEVRTIPLYDVDGETVIGEFELETEFEYITDTE